MLATSFSSMHSQRGDAILDALFGITLMAIVGLGLGFASVLATASQRVLNTQKLADPSKCEQLMFAGTIFSLSSNQRQSVFQVVDTSISHAPNCYQYQKPQIVCAGHSGSKFLVAGSLVTTLDLSIPKNESGDSAICGDGKITVGM